MHLTPVEPYVPLLPNEHYSPAKLVGMFGAAPTLGQAVYLVSIWENFSALLRYQAPLCGLFEEETVQGFNRIDARARTSVVKAATCSDCAVKLDDGLERGELILWQGGSVVRPIPLALLTARLSRCFDRMLANQKLWVRHGGGGDYSEPAHLMNFPEADHHMYRATIRIFDRLTMGTEAERHRDFVVAMREKCMGATNGTAFFRT